MVQYDGADKGKVTLGGTEGTTIANVKAGTLSADSKEAVTGSQLYTTNQKLAQEITDRTDADTALSNRIGTLSSDGSYIRKDSSVADNLSTLDTQVKANTDTIATNTTDIGNLKNLSNITNAGEAVIKGLAQGSVNVAGADLATVIKSTADGVDTYTVSVKAEGAVESGNTKLVTGGTVYTAVNAEKTARESADTALSGRIDSVVTEYKAADTALGGRIDNVVTDYKAADTALGTRIDNEAAARENAITQLSQKVTALGGNAVQYDDAGKGKVTLGGTEGTTIDNVKAGTLSADSKEAVNGSQLYSTNQALAEEIKNRTNADTALGDRITANENNITALDSRVSTNENNITDLGDRVTATEADIATNKTAITKNAEDITALDTRVTNNITALDAVKATADAAKAAVDVIGDTEQVKGLVADVSNLKSQDGQIVPEGEERADEFVKGNTVYEYLNKDNLSFGDNSTKIAIGKGSKVQSGTQSLAIGFGNTVDGDQNVAIGTGHTVKGSHNIAIGDPIELVGDNNGVIGNNVTINGSNTFVLGNNVTANVDNAVVLGNNSTAEANAVSVGSEGGERQIKHVAPGMDDTDAVNVAQLKAVDQNAVNNDIILNNRISNLDGKINKVGAGAAALAALHPIDTDDKFTMGLGYGNYRSSHAAAIGMFYRPTDKVMLSIGGSMGNGENLINVGVSFALDKGKGFGTSKAAMARKISLQEEKIAAQDEKIAAQEAENAEQRAEIQALKEALARLEAKVNK